MELPAERHVSMSQSKTKTSLCLTRKINLELETSKSHCHNICHATHPHVETNMLKKLHPVQTCPKANFHSAGSLGYVVIHLLSRKSYYDGNHFPPWTIPSTTAIYFNKVTFVSLMDCNPNPPSLKGDLRTSYFTRWYFLCSSMVTS